MGRDYADHQDYSEETARRIDTEVQRIMREAHERAEKILRERSDQLKLMANVLLERETVEGDAVEALLDNTWDEFLAKEQAGGKDGSKPGDRRKPRMSDEELAEDAARFAAEAVAADSHSEGDQD